MIVVRTSYPWTPSGVLFRQEIGDENLSFIIECFTIGNGRNGVTIREYVSGVLKSLQNYTYSSLFHFSQAVKQIMLADYGIELCFTDKFYLDVDDGDDFDA